MRSQITEPAVSEVVISVAPSKNSKSVKSATSDRQLSKSKASSKPQPEVEKASVHSPSTEEVDAPENKKEENIPKLPEEVADEQIEGEAEQNVDKVMDEIQLDKDGNESRISAKVSQS